MKIGLVFAAGLEEDSTAKIADVLSVWKPQQPKAYSMPVGWKPVCEYSSSEMLIDS